MDKAQLINQPCPYCGSKTKFVTSAIVYGRDYGPLLICTGYPACDSFVGCHADGTPKGTLANKELRKWRKLAHGSFDVIWKRGYLKRVSAYAWLSQALGIPADDTHIGQFDIDTCKRVIKLAKEFIDAN